MRGMLDALNHLGLGIKRSEDRTGRHLCVDMRWSGLAIQTKPSTRESPKPLQIRQFSSGQQEGLRRIKGYHLGKPTYSRMDAEVWWENPQNGK